jgi:SAM-dependent methyltransferase
MSSPVAPRLSAASPLTLDFHPSVRGPALRQAALAALQANRLDPKSLYVTPRQAELWREVFFQHSPLHGNPEFTRIYRDAFAQVLERFTAPKCLLVGLGCGTGAKEFDLYANLQKRGQSAVFSAIDVSADLVLESVEKLTAAGAEHHRSLVCDLGETAFLADWLNSRESHLPRLLTFFGLTPNFTPSEVARLLRSVLRPGDLLLVSAHLAPVREENREGLATAMRTVLPQYDNAETLAWLAAALDHQGLASSVAAPEMVIGHVEEIPAFLAQARWKTSEPFEREGHLFSPRAEEPLRLFSSLRYTPARFEHLLRRAGLSAQLLALTACRQEAIWSVRFDPAPIHSNPGSG